MLKDNNLVRLLRACETMGNATTICSDKTGTLTQNQMSVVAGTIGTWCGFGPTAPPRDSTDAGPHIKVPGAGETIATLCGEAQEALRESIVMNTTAFEGDGKGDDAFVGSKTETAMLLFCRDHLGMQGLAEDRAATEVVQVVPFDSSRKCMATIVKIPGDRYRMYVKGASEIMLGRCTCTVRDPTKDLGEMPLSAEDIEHLSETIETYASRSLRTIGIVYRDFDQWPPRGVPTQQEDPHQIDFDKAFAHMTFLAVIGIQDPLRPGAAKAVKDCQNAGVVVRMVTGDNLNTAKAIATDCGIYTPGGLIMEGPQFRRMNATQMRQIIPRLQVLARSSPDDKKTLVKRLREIGETVAVTGDGANDAAALRAADVGFSMGIAGVDAAKEASAIILMDDNFASIVKAVMWGRAVNDAVKKFLQFQVTVNITAVVLTFVSAVASKSETSVLTAVQLLWVNLIMDTFAALALATDPPTRSILDRKPEPKSAPLISITMWKMIIGQSIYQLAITLALYFAGPHLTSIFPSFNDPKDENNYDFTTTVFNTFVLMQIFNQYNCRRLDNKSNVLEGVLQNKFFIAIQMIIVAGQVLIVFKGGAAFSVNTNGLNGPQWAICLVLGFLSMPIAVVIRWIPDEFVRRHIPAVLTKKRHPEVYVSDDEHHFEWEPAFEEIKADLAFLKMVRGGRLNVLKYKIQHARELLPRSRSGTPSRSRASSVPASPLPQTPNSEQPQPSEHSAASPRPPQTPESGPLAPGRRRGRTRSNSALSPAAAMAGIVAGSIGGWHPIERRELGGEFAGRTPMRDRTDLEGYSGVELHPATKPEDPVVAHPDAIGLVPPSQTKELRPASQGASPLSPTGEPPELPQTTPDEDSKKAMES
jgi:P-type Ca2+ transporter type 2C